MLAAPLSLRAPASATVADPPILIRGVRPPGAGVTVTLRPNGKTAARIPIGGAVPSMTAPVTLTKGEFVAHLDPSAVPASYLSDHVVNLQIVAVQPSGESWVDNASARIVRVAGESMWAAPGATTSTNRTLAAQPKAVSAGRLKPIGRNVVDPQTSRAGTRSRASAACTTQVINRHNIKTKIAESYPVGKSTSWLRVDHSNGGRYQAAIKVPKHPVDKLNLQHADGGWGATTKRSRAGRAYFTRVKYLTYDNKYRDTDGYCQYYLTFEPSVETGALWSRKKHRPDYRHCAQVEGGTKWYRAQSDGSAYHLSGGVSAGGLVGVSLGLSKQYGSSTHAVVYKPRHTARMCGNDRVPAVASKVMERSR